MKGDGFVFGDDILEGVDPNTFTFVDNNGRYISYIRDKNAIFAYLVKRSRIWVSRVDGADISSFVGAGGSFGKDKNHVYFEDSIVVGADPSTFSATDDWSYEKDGSDYNYAKDGTQVFLNSNRINGADPITFEVPFSRFPEFARDSRSIYFKGVRTGLIYINGEKVGVDVKSFAVLTSAEQPAGYAKDRNHVYFFDNNYESDSCPGKLCVLKTADPKTFTLSVVAGKYDAKDASKYYYFGTVVTKDGRNTFED